LRNIPKIVSGCNKESLELCKSLYGQVINEIIPVNSLDEAEMVKLMENTFRVVNIALVNEMLMLCDKMGIDIWSVIDAANTKPYGFMAFYPGPGVGGHCIPLDPLYLSWKAKEIQFTTHFINLATVINDKMPKFVCYKATKLLLSKNILVRDSAIIIIGVSYKKDVHDVRESPALKVISELKALGAKVEFYDPYVSSLKVAGEAMVGVTGLDEHLMNADLAVICTDHSIIDWKNVARKARCILDTRNIIRKHVSKCAKLTVL